MDPHLVYPLRRIVKREVQDGKPMVLLACKHVMPGVPESRYSRFYPCQTCHQLVETLNARVAVQSASAPA